MNKKNIINVFSYMFAVILLVIIFMVFIKKEQIAPLKRIGIFAFLISVVFAFLSFLLSGLQYLFLRDRYKINLEKKDVILLPIVMNFWSFIIPLQGSTIFFTLFLKNKYNIKVVNSFSITIFLYLITIFFTGALGIVFSICYNMPSLLFTLISIILFLNPLFIIIVYKILLLIPDVKNRIILNIICFIKEMIRDLNELWFDYKNATIIILLHFFQIVSTVLWYLWIAKTLGYYNASLFSLTLLSLWINVSLIIRFTPNNLGIAQVISGILFSLINLVPEQGIMISLISSATSTVLAITVGAIGNYYYFQNWKSGTVKVINQVI